VRTYSATLNEQGIGEQLTWMWYRVKLTPPALPEGPLHLWFGEVDGAPTTVWVNGEKVGELAGRRRAGAVEVTGKLVPGKENEIVVRTNHGAISELMLGGILRPVMLVAGPAVPAPEPPKGK
jgi:beta-galactosidase/beta-glucuronidase